MKYREAIKAYGNSVAALAQAAGVTHQAVYKWKKEGRVPKRTAAYLRLLWATREAA